MSAAPKVKSAIERQDAKPSNRLANSADALLYSRPDWQLYCSLATLSQKAGVGREDLPWLVAKELTDNALDAADAAGNPGAARIDIDARSNLIVTDQGTGIPDATPESIAELFRVSRPMLSSKLLRRATRGAVGNGLRACLGYLTATQGTLIVETAGIRVELRPDLDGFSHIIGSGPSKRHTGTRLIATTGKRPFIESDLWAARNAIDLAQQSGRPAFSGRSSPHWHDADHFHVLTTSAVGNISVRQFLAQFDGCTGSRAQSEIAAQFLHRPIRSLTANDAAELLASAQARTRPPAAKILQALGREAIPASGYALEAGSFLEGGSAPHATIPFLVESWAHADRDDGKPPAISVFMNRTQAVTPCTIASPWHGRLRANVGGVTINAQVPSGPRYEITFAITAPMFRLTSDGKAPDLGPFQGAMTSAMQHAASRAGKDIAFLMSQQEKRAAAIADAQEREEQRAQRLAEREHREAEQALIAAAIAERKARPSVDDVVNAQIKEIADAIGAAGYPFGPRHIVYKMRQEVLERTGTELTQKYFDKLLTKWEAKHGPLHSLLVRSARGWFYIPHLKRDIPLGTREVAAFERPKWIFNKLLLIEKPDLKLILQESGWAERHDCMLLSSQGFTTRACRDLIDIISATDEPVHLYSAHDGDGPGSLIHESAVFATLARAARVAEIIDLGLNIWEGIALGLPTETVVPTLKKDGTPRRVPVSQLVRERTDTAPNGETWDDYLQHTRVELNAFSTEDLIAWLDGKFAELGERKLVPPAKVLGTTFADTIRERVADAIHATVHRERVKQITVVRRNQIKATAAIDRQIARITRRLRKRKAIILAPFQRRIASVNHAVDTIDQPAAAERTIARIMPPAEDLERDIRNDFRRDPERHWEQAIVDIAGATDIGDVMEDLP